MPIRLDGWNMTLTVIIYQLFKAICKQKKKINFIHYNIYSELLDLLHRGS